MDKLISSIFAYRDVHTIFQAWQYSETMDKITFCAVHKLLNLPGIAYQSYWSGDGCAAGQSNSRFEKF